MLIRQVTYAPYQLGRFADSRSADVNRPIIIKHFNAGYELTLTKSVLEPADWVLEPYDYRTGSNVDPVKIGMCYGPFQ